MAWEEHFKYPEKVTPLAILLDFQLGLRSGELAAIEWDDIYGGYIHIQRMNIRDYIKDENGIWLTPEYKVVEFTKSNAGDRKIYLSKEARKILKEVKKVNMVNGLSDSKYIFQETKEVCINYKAIAYRIEKYCKKIGIEVKRPHKIRKTFTSILLDSGQLNINKVREILGYEDEKTTLGNYCFSRKNKKQEETAFEDALRGVN